MVLFFDIDGTLWNYKNEINEKTIEAIRTARKNGHRCFINTGRARAFVTNKKLLDIGITKPIILCCSSIDYRKKAKKQNTPYQHSYFNYLFCLYMFHAANVFAFSPFLNFL